MVWSKLKKAFGFIDEAAESFEGDVSIHRLVNQNHLNRRKNVRINYPHLGAVGPFPQVFYQGHELNVSNISLGGLLVIDDTEQFGDEVGDAVQLEFTWQDFTTKVRSRVVGANLQRRHIQFIDFNAQAFLRINQLVKAGHLGQRFHQVRNDSGTLQAIEMWIGPTGESLVFTTDAKPAELSLGRDKFLISKNAPTLFAHNQKPIPPSMLNELLILFANFPKLSPFVKELVEVLEAEIRALTSKTDPHRTGTHG